MQWRPGDQGSQQRRAPLRGVLEALQAKAQPWLDRQPDFARPAYGSVINSGADMLPGVGDLVGLEDLQRATQEGDAVGMGLGLLGAIPGVPAVGKGVRRGVRRGLGLMDAAPAPTRPVGLMGQPEYRVQSSQDLAPTDTPQSLRAQGYEIDPQTNTWARVVGQEPRTVDDLVAGAEAMGARLDLSQGRNGLTLSRIEVPPSARSQGVGSEIMRQVESFADRMGLPVGLTPSGDFGGSVPRLKEFYQRFGFMPNTGRSRDFSTRETMLRQPRAVEPEPTPEPSYPIRAYHGSPHSFDRFSMDAIGTGEGAQAYGELPKTYYHGSPNHDITEIDPTLGGGNYGQGFYTTTIPDRARQYAGPDGRVYPIKMRGRVLDLTTPEGREIYRSTPPDQLRSMYDVLRAVGESVALSPRAARIIEADIPPPGMRRLPNR